MGEQTISKDSLSIVRQIHKSFLQQGRSPIDSLCPSVPTGSPRTSPFPTWQTFRVISSLFLHPPSCGTVFQPLTRIAFSSRLPPRNQWFSGFSCDLPSGSFLSAPSARQLTPTQCLWVIDGNFSSSFSPRMVQTGCLIVFLIILNFDMQKEVSNSHSVSECD